MRERKGGSGGGRARLASSRWGSDNLVLLAVLVIALAPIVLATARGIHRGWRPVGDDGLMYVQTVDVLSHRPPLLGIWSFGSVSAKSLYNHPGPLLYDLFAIPTKLFGIQGFAIAAALVNAAALIGIALVGRRLGGPLLATIAVAVTAVLCWTMGSELLFDPWTPNSLLLPFLLFLMLIWAASGGDLVALPVAVGVGSVLLQTNLSYGLLVFALWAWAVLGLFLRLRQRRVEEADAWPARRRQATRTAIVAAVVLVVCWAQPLIEQFSAPGQGNLARVIHGLPTIKNTLGLRGAMRLVGGVSAVPPWWLRPSMTRVYVKRPSLVVALVCLVVPVALLAWSAFDGRRRHAGVVVTAVVTSAIAVFATVITVSRSPVYGTFNQPYQTRFLWPLAAFLTIALIIGLVRWPVGVAMARPVLGLFALVSVLFSVLNLPASSTSFRVHYPVWTVPATADLVHQIGRLSHKRTLLVHWEPENPSYGFFVSGLLAELRYRDVPFVVDEGFLIRSLGDHRRFTGHNADEILRVATGLRAYVVPPGARRIALHRGLGQADQHALDTLVGQITTYIRDDKLRFNRRGEAILKRLAAGSGHAAPTERGFDAKALLGPSHPLLRLFTDGLLDLDRTWAARFDRYQQLQNQSDERTVAVFIAPLGGPGVEPVATPPRP